MKQEICIHTILLIEQLLIVFNILLCLYICLLWGLFNRYGKAAYDSKTLESRIKELMKDAEVTNKKGIYEYLLSGEERKLNLRAFTDKMKREAYERQNGICPKCNQHFEFDQMEGDHIIPWSKGGKTTAENCQMLCWRDNGIKSAL